MNDDENCLYVEIQKQRQQKPDVLSFPLLPNISWIEFTETCSNRIIHPPGGSTTGGKHNMEAFSPNECCGYGDLVSNNLTIYKTITRSNISVY